MSSGRRSTVTTGLKHVSATPPLRGLIPVLEPSVEDDVAVLRARSVRCCT
jgi:hypothetical protein